MWFRTLIHHGTASIPVNLDLGGALAAFGLIFAAYQLRKPQWDIVLRIRSKWQGNLFWILGGLGLAMTLVRALPQYVYGGLGFPLCSPLFYEISAYLFFVASPVSMLILSSRSKGLFTEKTARKFYGVLVSEVSKSDSEWANAVLEVLLPNLDAICEAAVNRREDDATAHSARAVLDVILSDQAMVKILTTKRLDALGLIFETVDKHGVSMREAGIGIPKLLQNLFYDEESFFYKHLNFSGLALSSNIYEIIFDSPSFLSNFDIFGFPTLDYSRRKLLGSAGVAVFIESLGRAIITYLKTGRVNVGHINKGLSYLSDIFGDLCLQISIEEGRGVDTKYSLKDQWKCLGDIARFLGHDYMYLAYQEELNKDVTEKERHAEKADFNHSSSTINAGIAAVIYQGFEQISYIKKTTDAWHLIVQLLHGMTYESGHKEGYRAPFEKRMWQQIATNVYRRHYPAPTRPYLAYFGFCLASRPEQRNGWSAGQAERVRRLLYVDLKPLFDEGASMINKKKLVDALLPESMEYKGGSFYHRSGFGKGEEKVIPPPAEPATSAIKDIDIDDSGPL